MDYTENETTKISATRHMYMLRVSECGRALLTVTNVESGTSRNKSGTSVNSR